MLRKLTAEALQSRSGSGGIDSDSTAPGASDLAAASALDAAAFDDPFPLSLWHTVLNTGGSAWLLQRESDPALLGFALFSRVLDEAELLRIALTPAARGQGAGRRLLTHALGALQREGCRRVMLEVRRSNQAAIRLYEGVGFVSEAVRRAYYVDSAGSEDALIYICTLAQPGES